jgi:hypothetical protein
VHIYSLTSNILFVINDFVHESVRAFFFFKNSLYSGDSNIDDLVHDGDAKVLILMLEGTRGRQEKEVFRLDGWQYLHSSHLSSSP